MLKSLGAQDRYDGLSIPFPSSSTYTLFAGILVESAAVAAAVWAWEFKVGFKVENKPPIAIFKKKEGG